MLEVVQSALSSSGSKGPQHYVPQVGPVVHWGPFTDIFYFLVFLTLLLPCMHLSPKKNFFAGRTIFSVSGYNV